MSSPSAFRRQACAGGVVGKKIKIGFAVVSARVVSFPSARDAALSGSDFFCRTSPRLFFVRRAIFAFGGDERDAFCCRRAGPLHRPPRHCPDQGERHRPDEVTFTKAKLDDCLKTDYACLAS